MRKVIYGMSVSLDGFIEAKDGDITWTDPGEELHRHFNEREGEIAIHLYGRRLYENLASYWPTADEDPKAEEYVKEYARLWRCMPKIVFSTTLEQVGWNTRLVRENIGEEVDKLKKEPGGDMSVSGAGLAASLIKLHLIDEFWLYMDPVILGGGKPMFPALRERQLLKLVETRTFDQGVVLLRYQRIN
jgi:dihydrofolate reductase